MPSPRAPPTRSLGTNGRCPVGMPDASRSIATQPELSKILRGKFSEVSLERLMRFLTALGHRIEIKIGTAKNDEAGEVVIAGARRRAA